MKKTSNYKELTIAGAILLLLLIAGVTYAWFILDVNVINGHYVLETEQYDIDYVKGNDVTDLPSVITPTPSNTSHIVVKAKKNSDSFTANLTLYLNTLEETDSEIIDEKIVKYAICVESCNSFSSTYTLTSSNKTAIIENQLLTTEYKEYNIYFWLDGATDINHLTEKGYSGYISAEAQLITE